MPAAFHHVIVIGASSGGISALLELSSALPAPFPAPICIVQHVGNNPSMLPELLRLRGPNQAVHAQDGDRLAAGTLHVAPPDRHLLLDGETLRLTHGPKENFARPAIDPLFHTAAASWGSRVIGIILTGQLDDGAAGLRAVQECGGTTIVQDPDTAVEPGMPLAALAALRPDHCVDLPRIAPLLQRLVGTPPPAQPRVPDDISTEVAMHREEASLEQLAVIGAQSPLTCPECGGGLWELKKSRPLRYRCHTGHAYSSVSLRSAQQDHSEQALWAGVRALREREFLLRRVAALSDSIGERSQAEAALAQAERLRRQSEVIVGIVETTPGDVPVDPHG